MRQKHTLTDSELAEWAALPQDGTEEDRATPAWIFWNRVCRARSLDSASLLAGPTPDRFSALPVGHTLPWCSPMVLACRRPPPEFEAPIPIREHVDV